MTDNCVGPRHLRSCSDSKLGFGADVGFSHEGVKRFLCGQRGHTQDCLCYAGKVERSCVQCGDTDCSKMTRDYFFSMAEKFFSFWRKL